MDRFRIVALPYERFAPLFSMDAAGLEAAGARLMVADSSPGFPCRVSLQDAAVGEEVVLLPYAHHDVSSPYRASGPVFVRREAVRARPEPGEIPAMLRHRLLSVRAYDASATMAASEVVEGSDLEASIARLLDRGEVDYLHIHNARPGCFNCAVERV